MEWPFKWLALFAMAALIFVAATATAAKTGSAFIAALAVCLVAPLVATFRQFWVAFHEQE